MGRLTIREASRPERARFLLERIGWTLLAVWIIAALAGAERGMVLRAALVYLFILILFRIAGARTLANFTSFDMVLLLIISEAAQPALNGPDSPTLIGALTSIATLVGLDILFSLAKQRFQAVETVVDGRPLVLISEGKVIPGRLELCRITIDEVLAAARNQGIGELEQIYYAVMEVNGHISVIPLNSALQS